MAFLLDTNIIIHARDGTKAAIAKLAEHDGAIMISALSLAELQRGFVQNVPEAALRRARLETLLAHIPVVSFDVAAAEAYGGVLMQCGWVKGRDYDRMIAGHALSLDAVLVTNNESDFRDIPGLKLENWVSDA